MKFILGKKINMTQVWQDDKVIPVTKVLAGPCFISQIKNEKSDGYQALQISFADKKVKNINKPLQGHFQKAGLKGYRYLKEFRIKEIKPEMQLGAQIDLSSFQVADQVDVTGVSKGKGFQGVVRRFGFAGSKKTHGNKDQLRAPGSIGDKGSAQVFKGKKMAGRMGGDQRTIKNLEIIEIDLENNFLYLKGGVPGARNSLLIIKGPGDLIIKEKKEEPKEKKENLSKEKTEELKNNLGETDKNQETPQEEKKESSEPKNEIQEEAQEVLVDSEKTENLVESKPEEKNEKEESSVKELAEDSKEEKKEDKSEEKEEKQEEKQEEKKD